MTYDSLYSAKENNILWGDSPGRLVKRITEFLKSGKVLDAGCGDGKNSLFLEELGFDVTGFDISHHALEGLKNRFELSGRTPTGRYVNGTFTSVNGVYDALISYGLFHCLPKTTRVQTHRQLQDRVRPNGYILFTTLTDKISLPDNHNTQEINLVTSQEITDIFEGYTILEKTEGEITEDHLPLVGQHTHSAVWIIAKK